jgi:hypothetical protein
LRHRGRLTQAAAAAPDRAPLRGSQFVLDLSATAARLTSSRALHSSAQCVELVSQLRGPEAERVGKALGALAK